jgi:DNA-directed RNA polymerase subunit omega
MARITIEDCTERVSNRFHLVQMAAIRAKQLKKGAHALVQNEENKEVVVALREIAAGFVNPDLSPGSEEAEGEADLLPELGAEAPAAEAPAEEAPAEEPPPES